MIAAFDIGSTNMNYAAGTSKGKLHTQVYSEKTNAQSLKEQIREKINFLEKETGVKIEKVCIACTGLIDRENNLIERFDTRNGGFIENIEIGEAFDDRKIFMENDANAAALGEYFLGSGKNDEHMIRVAIGTGIGAGIIENGDLLEGLDRNAGEIGHIIVDKDGMLSQEGIDGSWEAYCSGRGVPEFANSLYPSLNVSDAEEVFEKAENGEEKAEKVLEKVHELNAKALGTVTNLFAPETIVIAGSVAAENPEIIDNIEKRIGKYCYVNAPEIRETDLEEAGIYGALTLPIIR